MGGHTATKDVRNARVPPPSANPHPVQHWDASTRTGKGNEFMDYETDFNFHFMQGLTLARIDKTDDRVELHTTDGRSFLMYHSQDCCESVSVESVIGNIEDVLGSPITHAERVISSENPPGFTKEYQDSFTWTTFTVITAKGSLVIRWYGESNGYYSESVSFSENKP